MSKNKNDSIAWSIYWSADRLHSCIAAADGADQEILEDIWATCAGQLPENSTVLDLATGNGAVPVALLRAQPSLKITAVDQADIDPARYVSEKPQLADVLFLGSTDINQLDVDQDSFDAITSQFGIEYAGLLDASSKAFEFLSEEGSFTFIVHHAESELIKASALKQAEMNNLLAADGLVDVLLQVLRGEAEFSFLENLGREYADSDNVKTEAISGQVFSGIEQIALLMNTNPEKARNLGATLKLRLQAEHDRLEQMLAAAQTAQQIADYCAHLDQLGFTIVDQSPIYVDHDQQPYLLAWLLKGSRL